MLVVAAAGWLTFVLLHRMLGNHWWPWVFLDLGPPITLLVVPALLLTAVAAVRVVLAPLPVAPRRGIVLAAVAALVLGLPDAGINPYAPVHATGRGIEDRAADRGAGGTIRVVAWNTEYWDQDDDPQRFLRFLVAQRADVYLLQEYLNWDRAAGLDGARPVDDLARLRRAFPGFAIAARGELLTLSRFPIVARPAVGADRTVRPDTGATFADVFTAAKVLRTDLQIGGARLSAYNVHLPVRVDLGTTSDPLAFARDRRAQWRARMNELSADVDANAGHVLVAGDFNVSPGMGGLRGTGLARRLRDAADASSSPYPASWPAGSLLAWWRLDWALTSPGVRVHGYDLRASQGLSDHRPQHLSISIGEPR